MTTVKLLCQVPVTSTHTSTANLGINWKVRASVGHIVISHKLYDIRLGHRSSMVITLSDRQLWLFTIQFC